VKNKEAANKLPEPSLFTGQIGEKKVLKIEGDK
jgi:hypothetical protein